MDSRRLYHGRMLDQIHSRTSALSAGLTQLHEACGPSLAQISARLTQTLLTEGRILTCGVGQQSALAQMFASQLNHKLGRERPALPAYCLNTDAVLMSSIASSSSGSEIYAHQLRAHAQPQDLLVILCATGSESACLKALSAAHDREIGCIVISDEDGGQLSALINHEDQELRLPARDAGELLPLQLVCITLLSELIEHQLFG